MNLASEKLQNLSLKIDFMFKLNTDFENFAEKSFQDLFLGLEKFLARTDSEVSVDHCIENIKMILQQRLEGIVDEHKDLIDSLLHYRELIESVAKIPTGERKEELATMLLDEAGAEEELETFKKRVMQDEIARRKEFKEFVDEIQETIQEGDIIELEAFLEHELLKKSAEKFAEDEEEFGEENFSEEEVAKFLNQLKDPISYDAADQEAIQLKDVADC